MTIGKVLENLEELLSEWGITVNDWILTAQYADRLLGYKVKVRKGHLNILVKKLKIPWEIGDSLETHPPSRNHFAKEYQWFIDKTKFEFDIIPIPLKHFEKKVKKCITYQLKNRKRFYVQTPWGGLEELDDILSKSTKRGWGEEKGFRVYPYLDIVRKAALKKREIKLVKSYETLIKKYRHFKKIKIPKVIKNHNKFIGITASKGKVTGRVNVILDPDKSKKFARSEILVTTMTSPKFTVFLKKASAVITNEGGLLSHAAIVAREMKIPGIVGTKIATKVLKDGDLVEVDADNGVVRKLV